MSNEHPHDKPPRGYWIGVSLAALFVLFGLIALLGSLVRNSADTQAQLGFAPDLPFRLLLGVAILGEVGGVLGLFIRRTWATWAFSLSLVFTILYYAYVLPKTGWSGSLAGPIVITALHVVLVWFALVSARRGWTRPGSVRSRWNEVQR